MTLAFAWALGISFDVIGKQGKIIDLEGYIGGGGNYYLMRSKQNIIIIITIRDAYYRSVKDWEWHEVIYAVRKCGVNSHLRVPIVHLHKYGTLNNNTQSIKTQNHYK